MDTKNNHSGNWVDIEWRDPENDTNFPQFKEWYKGEHLNFTPTKAQLFERFEDSVLKGWKPQQPLITQQTRVLALGSCFAEHFIKWLALNGFNQQVESPSENALIRFGSHMESPAVVAQQFQWAFDEVDSRELTWVDSEKSFFKSTEERKRLVRTTLEQTDVLIVTLGISEVWYDIKTEQPLWRTIPRELYDPTRHVFRVESVGQTLKHLETIHRIRREKLPNLKILFTVSPIRLIASFRPTCALTANTVSKSIIRATLDEFLRNHQSEVNQNYFYFPSYEIVMEVFRDAFVDDRRHMHDFVPKAMLSLFAEFYTDHKFKGEEPEWRAIFRQQKDSPVAVFEQQIANLEQQLFEKEKVIAQLKTACDERLSLINELDRCLKSAQRP